MYVIAFNGSPRKDGTTATLLKKSLEGAASQGAETEFIQLNKLRMKGCQACFECKKRSVICEKKTVGEFLIFDFDIS